MDNIRKILFCVLVFSSFFVNNAHANDLAKSPIGYWKSIDRITGKPKSIIQITRAEDSTLIGKIIKVFPATQGKSNQPTVGMVILSGLVAHQNKWSHGKIIDPENGKIYDCLLRLGENGKSRFNVR
jgi:uncharacterized protein (DUF2147 family)